MYKFIIILFLVSCSDKSNNNIKNNKDTKCAFETANFKNLKNLKNICKIKYTDKSFSCVDYLAKNKHVINKQYLYLWQKNYNKLINNTELAFYTSELASYEDLANINLDIKDIDYTLKAQAFIFAAYQAYANFANHSWGGGVLRGANVQEEIKMRQSTALPWISQKYINKTNYVSWCPEININQLNQDPVTMLMSIFLDFDYAMGYGKKLYSLSKQEQKNLLKPMPQAIPIYSMAMAAPYVNKNSLYQEEIIKNMLYTATKAFYTTMLAMNFDNRDIKINTGNWGAGAFNHSVKMSWAIQLFAFSLAQKLFYEKTKSKQNIKYIYNSFGEKEAAIIKEALLEINSLIITKPNLNKIINSLLVLSNQNSSWQIGASSIGEH